MYLKNFFEELLLKIIDQSFEHSTTSYVIYDEIFESLSFSYPIFLNFENGMELFRSPINEILKNLNFIGNEENYLLRVRIN